MLERLREIFEHITNTILDNMEHAIQFSFTKYAAFVFFALTISYLKYLVWEESQSIKGLFKSVTAIILLAISLGMILEQTTLGPVVKYTVVAGTVLVFDYVFIGILKLGKAFSESPERFIDRYFERRSSERTEKKD